MYCVLILGLARLVQADENLQPTDTFKLTRQTPMYENPFGSLRELLITEIELAVGTEITIEKVKRWNGDTYYYVRTSPMQGMGWINDRALLGQNMKTILTPLDDPSFIEKAPKTGSLQSLPEPELSEGTIDLRKGTISGIGMKNLFVHDVIKHYGKPDAESELSGLSYYSKGLSFLGINKETQKVSIISVFLQDYTFFNSLTNREVTYKTYQPNVFPIKRGEKVEDIIRIFGKPDKYDPETLDGTPRAKYKISYGTLEFYFNEKGVVDTAQIFVGKN